MAKYTKVPRNEYPFNRVDAMSRYAFGLIYDRWSLSAREDWRKWVDECGIYCVYAREDLAAELGVTLPTLRKCMDQLIKAGLIEQRRAGKQGAFRYYPTALARLNMEVPEGFVEYYKEQAYLTTNQLKKGKSEKIFHPERKNLSV